MGSRTSSVTTVLSGLMMVNQQLPVTQLTRLTNLIVLRQMANAPNWQLRDNLQWCGLQAQLDPAKFQFTAIVIWVKALS